MRLPIPSPPALTAAQAAIRDLAVPPPNAEDDFGHLGTRMPILEYGRTPASDPFAFRVATGSSIRCGHRPGTSQPGGHRCADILPRMVAGHSGRGDGPNARCRPMGDDPGTRTLLRGAIGECVDMACPEGVSVAAAGPQSKAAMWLGGQMRGASSRTTRELARGRPTGDAIRSTATCPGAAP